MYSVLENSTTCKATAKHFTFTSWCFCLVGTWYRKAPDSVLLFYRFNSSPLFKYFAEEKRFVSAMFLSYFYCHMWQSNIPSTIILINQYFIVKITECYIKGFLSAIDLFPVWQNSFLNIWSHPRNHLGSLNISSLKEPVI